MKQANRVVHTLSEGHDLKLRAKLKNEKSAENECVSPLKKKIVRQTCWMFIFQLSKFLNVGFSSQNVENGEFCGEKIRMPEVLSWNPVEGIKTSE